MSKDGIKEINPINIDTKGTNINYSGASRKLSGKKALKQTIKKIKKTPNKNFRQDKSYTLDIPSKKNPNQKTFQRIEGGKEQKKKAIQQQQDIYNKQKEDYRSPFKKGGSAKPGLWANINRRKRLGISRPKSKSTISAKAYANMKAGFPKKKK